MIEWKDGTRSVRSSDARRHRQAHIARSRRQAGLGNVWSLESLRRWLRGRPATSNIETVQELRRLAARASDAPLHRRGAERRSRHRAAARRRRQPDPARGRQASTARSTPSARPIRATRFRSRACRRSPRATARSMIGQLNESCPSSVIFVAHPARPRVPLAVRRRPESCCRPVPDCRVGRGAVGARRRAGVRQRRRAARSSSASASTR